MTIPELLNNICSCSHTTKWGALNLDILARGDLTGWKNNPLLDPDWCEEWVKAQTNIRGYDYSYGGLHENRAFLWRGSYLKAPKTIHLGVDINVPEDTSIKCPVEFTIREAFVDKDQNGGWGQRIVVETKKGLVLFAHLKLPTVLDFNAVYPAGSIVGRVAGAKTNGGWFPHVHIQALKTINELKKVDGYGKHTSTKDPLQILMP